MPDDARTEILPPYCFSISAGRRWGMTPYERVGVNTIAASHSYLYDPQPQPHTFQDQCGCGARDWTLGRDGRMKCGYCGTVPR